MPEVFISYSRRDKPVAEAIAQALETFDIDVWWDTDLLGGENYRKKTAQIIERAPVSIVIWSRSAVESEWVVGEASAARERKTLVPVTIDRGEVPLDFRSLNTVDLSDWAAGDPLPDMLMNAICDKTGRTLPRAPGESRVIDSATLRKSLARSWYADFESLLFSLIAQGFASSLTMIPLAMHHDTLPLPMTVMIALLNATITGAIIMRPTLATQRLGIAAFWFAAAVIVGLGGYYVTLTLHAILTMNVYMTFIGFWALGLVIMLDLARRAAGR